MAELDQPARDLSAEDLYVRRRAASALARSPSPSALPALLAALNDKDYYVRSRAAEALGVSGEASAAGPLRAALRDDNVEVRLAATGALACLGDQQAKATLLAILRGDLPGDSGEAARFLGHAADPALVPLLLDQLWRSSDYTQAMIIDALGRLGDPRAIPWLLEQLASSGVYYEPGVFYRRPPQIRHVARAALRMLRLPQPAAERWRDLTLTSAYHPKELAPGRWESLLVYVFRGRAAERVASDAARELGLRTAEFRDVAGTPSPTMPDGVPVVITPSLPGFEFNPASAQVRFEEDWHRVPFRVRTSSAPLNHSVNGTIAITADGAAVAEIPIAIHVSENPDGLAVFTKSMGRLALAVFCSYSHEDEAVVVRVERACRALGIQSIRDVESLRSGDSWSERLLQLIDDSDLFQLFWSTAAAKSPYVEKEWRHALTLRRDGFVRPVCWSGPADPPPPPELQDLHFAYVPELAGES